MNARRQQAAVARHPGSASTSVRTAERQRRHRTREGEGPNGLLDGNDRLMGEKETHLLCAPRIFTHLEK